MNQDINDLKKQLRELEGAYKKKAETRFEKVRQEEEKLLLLVADDCPGCREAELRYKEEIDKGNLFVLNTNTELGETVAKKLNIKTAPGILLASKTENGLLKVCNEGECIEIEKKEKKEKRI